ncbi:MAG TPA: hypothetical protein VM243_17020 [Phycisphaerae bacterium]|nr:hypothetical protein [Phycisphaerae bacterium]
MLLSGIRVHDTADCPESLAWALHAVFRWAGREVPYGSLAAVLGLPFLTTSTGRDDDCLGEWAAHGRDLLLPEAGAGLGLRLRDMHPPDAARGLDRAPEFAQHFEASYLPLVLRAVEHNQPVLAWQGWPGDRRMTWGVITEAGESGIGLAGTTVRSGGQAVPLVSPPLQLYAIEEVARQQPKEGEMLRFAVAAAHRVLHDPVGRCCGVLTGAAAYDMWANRLERNAVCPHDGGKSGRCHSLLAGSVIGSRKSAVEYLRRALRLVQPDGRPVVDALIASLHGQIDALASGLHQDRVRNLIRTPVGRASLAATVRAVRDLEQPMGATIAELSDRIGVAGRGNF